MKPRSNPLEGAAPGPLRWPRRALPCGALLLAATAWACSSGGGGAVAPVGATDNASAANDTSAPRTDAGRPGSPGTDSGPPPATPDPGSAVDAGPAQPPGTFSDSMRRIQRMPGSSFVEIQEVRAAPDGMMYFCSGVRGLNVVDARDPGNLRVLRNLVSSAGDFSYPRCQHLFATEDTLLFTNRGDEIQPIPFIAAFSLPDFQELAVYQEDGRIFEQVTQQGDRVYAAMHENGVKLLQLTGQRMIPIGDVGGFKNAWGLEVSGDKLYVGDGSGGFKVVDLAATPPKVVGSLALPGSSQSVQYDADTSTVWVAAGNEGLFAVDVSDPTNPVEVGHVDTPGTSLQATFTRNVTKVFDDGSFESTPFVLVADWGDARIFDVRDRTAPKLVSVETIQTSDSFTRILGASMRSDNIVFLGEWAGMYAYQFIPGVTAPDIKLSAHTLGFNAKAGELAAAVLIIENEGSETLGIDDIEAKSSGAVFSLDKRSLVVQPGEKKTVEITFAPTHDSEVHGDLILRSNDPDEGEARVLLVGNQAGTSVGDDGPEVVARFLDSTDTFRLSDHEGEVTLLAYFATF